MKKRNIVLHNGVTMPPIGYGVFRMTNLEECEHAVVQAIQTGYRLIDTAAAYQNETAVGRAINRVIAEGIVRREELFVTTKLWVTDTCYERAKEGFYRSLDRLGLDYVDLYLIHQPYNDYYGAWRALEELYEEGCVKSIGVDNFTQDRMADFLFFNRIKPAVNMIECNAYFQREDERSYLEQQNILMQAWSPLAAGKEDLFTNQTICSIAENHRNPWADCFEMAGTEKHCSGCQVCQSCKNERKSGYFDFILSEMKQMASLDTGHTYATEYGKSRPEFLETANRYQVKKFEKKRQQREVSDESLKFTLLFYLSIEIFLYWGNCALSSPANSST